MKQPFVVGISGGIGSGKSAVARIFERLGARVIDADRIAHEVLLEPGVRAAIRKRFGESVMRQDQVDRGALAKAVFGESAEHAQARTILEGIVHPRILERIDGELMALRSADRPPKVVIIDAPLLSETPLLEDCDEVLFVDAPEAQRMARTRSERSWTAEQHRAREKAQTAIDRRRNSATRVLSNDGSLADLEKACRALYDGWTAAA